MCAGIIMRICFQFPTQLPRSFSAPRTDQIGREAPGTITAVQGWGGAVARFRPKEVAGQMREVLEQSRDMCV